VTIRAQSGMVINRAEEYKRRAADCMREAGCVRDDMLRQAYFQLARHGIRWRIKPITLNALKVSQSNYLKLLSRSVRKALMTGFALPASLFSLSVSTSLATVTALWSLIFVLTVSMLVMYAISYWKRHQHFVLNSSVGDSSADHCAYELRQLDRPS
jgi:hypothetical protein